MLALNGSCGLFLVLKLDVGKSATSVLETFQKKQSRKDLLPLAQASGISSNDDIFDGTEFTELAIEICCGDIEENVPDVD